MVIFVALGGMFATNFWVQIIKAIKTEQSSKTFVNYWCNGTGNIDVSKLQF